MRGGRERSARGEERVYSNLWFRHARNCERPVGGLVRRGKVASKRMVVSGGEGLEGKDERLEGEYDGKGDMDQGRFKRIEPKS